jgi:hypothetical protein
MKIKYLSGPRAGQTEHVPNSQEFQVLAKAGIIEIVPYKDFRERLAAETAAQAATAPPATTRWAVRENPVRVPDKLPFQVLKILPSGETLYFAYPPDDAPPEIRKRFAQMIANDEQAWRDRQEFLKRQAAEPADRLGYNEADIARVYVIGKNGGRREQ